MEKIPAYWNHEGKLLNIQVRKKRIIHSFYILRKISQLPSEQNLIYIIWRIDLGAIKGNDVRIDISLPSIKSFTKVISIIIVLWISNVDGCQFVKLRSYFTFRLEYCNLSEICTYIELFTAIDHDPHILNRAARSESLAGLPSKFLKLLSCLKAAEISIEKSI